MFNHLALFSILCAHAFAGNDDVIILVHGFFGWGPSEMLGFNYWGGVNNIAKELQAVGHDVRIGVCGPVSSNWDRAVELYHYIKGGRVDYGSFHATKFNHSRFGKEFPGIYPEWGTLRPDGSVRRVHFIAHSMGGQTVRMLLHLLANGDQREREQKAPSELFHGGVASWVHSISTLNTPHDGTWLVNKSLGSFRTFAWNFFKGICAINGLFTDDLVYDFKLEQFGLERKPGEGFLAYAARVGNSSIWEEGFEDFSAYDLGLEGARRMNSFATAQPNVYYFSYACVDTKKTLNPFSHCQVPQLLMWEFLKPSAYLMGCHGDESWWQSDGVVNSVSQKGPTLNSHDVIETAEVGNQSWKPGIWNYMGARNGVDHVENIGIGVQPVTAYYKAIAARVASLPDHAAVTGSLAKEVVVV